MIPAITAPRGGRYTVQDPVFHLMLWAIQESQRFRRWDSFREYVCNNLPFGSQSTRRRFTPEILKIFPGENLDAMPAKTWRSYQDERLLEEVIRGEWLSAAPKQVGRFIIDWLPRYQAGDPIGEDARQAFLTSEPGLYDPQAKLLNVMVKLGFLRKESRRYVIAPLTLPKTAFMLCLLHRFAPEPATVSMRRILDDPFWRYLGGRDESEVRRAIADAQAAGLVRHERVDQLDQITTRISLDDFLKRKVRL